MDRLPAVLRREIWDYVHGDRLFWRRQFRTCLDQLGQPYNIRHQFEGKDAKQRTFFETLNLGSYPVHEAHGTFIVSPGMYRIMLNDPERVPLVRFSQNGRFENGSMLLPRESDIINEVIFTENVPTKVWLCFPTANFHDPEEFRLRLKPIGNRLKFPWIPMVILHLCEIRLLVEDETQSFPCKILHCHIRNESRDFIAENGMTTTFQVGDEKCVIRYDGYGFAKIKWGRSSITPKPHIECHQPMSSSPSQPSSLFGAIRDVFGSLFSK